MPAPRAISRASTALLRAGWSIASALVVVGAIAIGVFAALLLLVRFAIFPHIERYRDTLTAAISRQVQQPVEIEAITTGWNGWNPRLVIENFRIGRAPALLELPRVDLTISWTSLPLLELSLDRLVIEKPRLAVRRDAQGLLHVAGIEIDTDAKEEPRVSDWLLRQREIVVRDALITWTDEQRNAPQLVLDDVDFRLERRFGRRYFGLRGNPPAEIASPIDIRGELNRGSLRDWAHAEGRVYVRLDYADVAAWAEWLPLPKDITSGKGAVRAWFTIAQGEPREVVADLELADVRMRLAPNLPELALPQLRGRAGWRSSRPRHEFYARQLGFTTASGATLEPANLTLTYDAADDGTIRSGHFEFDHLALLPVREVASELPLPPSVRSDLQAYQPTGALANGKLQWTGTFEEPQSYSASTEFRDVGFLPHGAVPGATRLAGTLEVSDKGGEVKLSAQHATLLLPQESARPVAIDSASGDVTWTRSGDDLALRVPRVEFSNADAAGRLSGSYRHAGAGRGTIDLDGQLTRVIVASVPRYFPAQVPQHARDWVSNALRGQTISDVKVKLKGDLDAFPFPDGKNGLFAIDITGKNLALDYAPGWPAISDIAADVHFRNAGLTVNASRARIDGVELADVSATIPDLREGQLAVTGTASGATRDFLRFIAATPVDRWTGHFASAVQVLGDGKLELKLNLPLHDLPSTRVAGDYAFSGNEVKLADVPALTQLAGHVAFTERDARGTDIAGQALGGPVRLGLASSEGHVRVTGAGSTAITTVAKEWDVPMIGYASGSADWTLVLDVGGDAPGWVVESPLKGVAIALPPPLHKAAPDVMPLRVERRAVSGEAADTMQVSLGNVAHVALHRSMANGALATDRVLATLGNGSAQPEARRPERAGLWVRADLPAIDVDQWLRVNRTGGGPAASANAPGDALALNGLDLTTASLTVFGREFKAARVAGRRVQGEWRLGLDATEIEGNATWSQPTPAAPNGRIVARLTRLVTPHASTTADAPPDAAGKESGTDWPELDVTAEMLRSGTHDLGRMQLLARPQRGEWRIERLLVENDSGRMDTHGAWRTGTKPEETRLDVDLDVKDAGAFLARFGHPNLVQGAATKISGQLAWAGAPSDFDYPSLSGEFSIETSSGRFMKVEPGIGKLLGVLSLQALPRRITLDFRDVFSEGFAFDRVTGKVRIANGVMSTDDLRLSGPSAQVAIAGSADLSHETQQLQVKVQPTLSAGVSAGAALLFLANPMIGAAVGAGSLLAQKALRDPIEQIFSYRYAVTGSWSDPVVTRASTVPAANIAKP